MTNDVSLLPCPFCGSTDINTEGPCYDQFMCNGCGVSQYDQPGHAEAIAAWNRRSTDGEAVTKASTVPDYTSEAERAAVKAGETAAMEYSGGRVGVFLSGLLAYRTALHPAPIEPVAATDEMTVSAARFARLYGVCRRILWTGVGIPALDNDQTKAALCDLSEFLFMDGVDAALTGASSLPQNKSPCPRCRDAGCPDCQGAA